MLMGSELSAHVLVLNALCSLFVSFMNFYHNMSSNLEFKNSNV